MLRDGRSRACLRGEVEMIRDVSVPKKIFLALISLGVLYIFFGFSRQYTVQYVCNGIYTNEYHGSKEKKDSAVFGIKIDRYDNIFGKGAYVNTTLMEDISDTSITSTSVRLYMPREGTTNPKMTDNESMLMIEDWKSEKDKEGEVILFYNLTQTLHYVSRHDQGKWIQAFAGNCHPVNKS